MKYLFLISFVLLVLTSCTMPDEIDDPFRSSYVQSGTVTTDVSSDFSFVGSSATGDVNEDYR